MTPMMRQWAKCKEEAKGALLLFRLGDFYEAFHDDAEVLARDLELTLTKRQEVPMAGIPAHAAEKYLEQLIEKGHLVAIAEQMQDAKEVKGMVERKVVRTISPATVFSDRLLQSKSNNYFAAIWEKSLVFVDLTTGELRAMAEVDDMEGELARVRPSEVLAAEKIACGARVTVKERWHFDHETAIAFLTRHFGTAHLDGFGLRGEKGIVAAAGALLSHLQNDLSLPIDHVVRMEKIVPGAHMAIDATTARHLELFETLLPHLDQTRTPMGGRLLKKWLLHPLLSIDAIAERQEGVEELAKAPFALIKEMSLIRDLERLITRLTTGNASPRDLLALSVSLAQVEKVETIAKELKAPVFGRIVPHIKDHRHLVERLESALVDTPPLRLADGPIIRPGYNAELDRLRSLKSDSQSWLAAYQARLRQETGISTLKVGYTKAFGYYIEVSRAKSDAMPISFHKRQTLTNAERFISEELKEYETKVLSAEEEIEKLEASLYKEIVETVCASGVEILSTSRAIAYLDALLSLASLARTAGYVRPLLDESLDLEIEAGSHPTLLNTLGAEFIPNETHLVHDTTSLMLITGPNMAGKSTYIRQVALLTIMAQIGSWVPAAAARIGVVDKIFSRIGASDDLARGQSTFMVEMSETANILHNATERSLVILDEIGRGTSTYDGISIAWAVAEALLERGTKTLFATHYWEMTDLEAVYPKAKNYTVAVEETASGITFLHKIVPGGTDRSYGIHVARLAGIPRPVIERAEERLAELEAEGRKERPAAPVQKPRDHLREEIDRIDVNQLTPLEALQRLAQIKALC